MCVVLLSSLFSSLFVRIVHLMPVSYDLRPIHPISFLKFAAKFFPAAPQNLKACVHVHFQSTPSPKHFF